jgi:hypothetical protein
MKSIRCAIPLLLLAMLAPQSAQSGPHSPAALTPVADCIRPLSAPDAVVIQPLDPVTETGAQPPEELPPLAAEHALAQGTDADILPLALVSIPIEAASPAAVGEERPIQPRELPRVSPVVNDRPDDAALIPLLPSQPEPLPRVSAAPAGC